MLIRFLFYGFLGWSLEVLYTGTAALIKGDWRLEGFTYLWMFLIYGMGGFLEKVHDLIRSTPWLVRGAVWLAVIWMIEYSTGWGLKTLLGACPWDYGNSVYSVNGFIRLDMAVEWFCTGLLFERIHDWLDGVMDNVQSRQARD
jgi:uncharacterized membrane protein